MLGQITTVSQIRGGVDTDALTMRRACRISARGDVWKIPQKISVFEGQPAYGRSYRLNTLPRSAGASMWRGSRRLTPLARNEGRPRVLLLTAPLGRSAYRQTLAGASAGQNQTGACDDRQFCHSSAYLNQCLLVRHSVLRGLCRVISITPSSSMPLHDSPFHGPVHRLTTVPAGLLLGSLADQRCASGRLPGMGSTFWEHSPEPFPGLMMPPATRIASTIPYRHCSWVYFDLYRGNSGWRTSPPGADFRAPANQTASRLPEINH